METSGVKLFNLSELYEIHLFVGLEDYHWEGNYVITGAIIIIYLSDIYQMPNSPSEPDAWSKHAEPLEILRVSVFEIIEEYLNNELYISKKGNCLIHFCLGS